MTVPSQLSPPRLLLPQLMLLLQMPQLTLLVSVLPPQQPPLLLPQPHTGYTAPAVLRLPLQTQRAQPGQWCHNMVERKLKDKN
jgi:hypothetical protein